MRPEGEKGGDEVAVGPEEVFQCATAERGAGAGLASKSGSISAQSDFLASAILGCASRTLSYHSLSLPLSCCILGMRSMT